MYGPVITRNLTWRTWGLSILQQEILFSFLTTLMWIGCGPYGKPLEEREVISQTPIGWNLGFFSTTRTKT
ncbi:hypothetical protein VIGAN_05038800 [Vigna angularis var. angularis]|uniref:Uncharacterized protein n=1 Tax=Vigna angularis var. angularis TaxID=157739 RepID=A0A0S3S2I4_PHAAN|nr:hypothetical protein VIGAN_05038800 [Vigna angularis var. angularis]